VVKRRAERVVASTGWITASLTLLFQEKKAGAADGAGVIVAGQYGLFLFRVLAEVFVMKCLNYLLCVLFLAAAVVTIPCGCGPGEATKIDAENYTVEDEEGESEEDYPTGPGQ